MSLHNKKLFYFFDAADWESRFELAKAAQNEGAKVTIGLIGAKEKKRDEISNITIIPLEKIKGGSKSIGASFSMMREMRTLIKQQSPDIIHTVTLKYGLITALAAMGRRTNKIFTIAGLGYLYRSDVLFSKILRTLLWPLLIVAFRQPHTHLIFQNADDRDLMLRNKIARKTQAHLIKGSGVYLERFDARDETKKEGASPLVLMPTRLVHEKGIAVFIEAARILKGENITARFEIAGGLTHDNPRAITQKEMQDMTQDAAVTWLGRIDNMPEKLKEAVLIVYPSYYGEGIPRVLLEACAAGRAIITTDHPGCREAVEHDRNGMLVPVKDAKATAEAIETLLNQPKRLKAMGEEGRKKAEEEFDIYEIVRQTLSVYSNVADEKEKKFG